MAFPSPLCGYELVCGSAVCVTGGWRCWDAALQQDPEAPEQDQPLVRVILPLPQAQTFDLCASSSSFKQVSAAERDIWNANRALFHQAPKPGPVKPE